MKSIIISLINFYQTYLSFDKGVLAFFAPIVGSSPNGRECKYEISCSEYTKQQISKHGVIRGSQLGLKRIWSCK